MQIAIDSGVGCIRTGRPKGIFILSVWNGVCSPILSPSNETNPTSQPFDACAMGH